jgi:ketosteroid isomerase-like protein
MSQENLEIQRRLFDALNRRDLDAYLAGMDPEVEITSRFIGQGTYHGHDGAREWWKDIFATLPNTSFEVVELRSVGDRVLSIFRVVGHGTASVPAFAQMAWVTGEWRDGKCVSWCSHQTEAEALAAMGLRE